MTKSPKWESPGIDKVTNFWLNALSSSYVLFTILLNEIMQNSEKKLLYGYAREQTYLLAKSNDTKDPKSNVPITCLPTTCKLLTSVLKDRTYSHLEQKDLIPLEQKGYTRVSYGCKDQLINKMILENCKKRKRNLSCAWID